MSPTHELFDPLSDTFARDPYSVYATLREQAAPIWHPGLGVHLLASYALVDAAARGADFVRTRDAFAPPEEIEAAKAQAGDAMPNHSRYVQFSLLDSDGEVHRRLRKLLLGRFARGAVQRYRPVIESFLTPLLDAAIDRRQFDFVEQLASAVPGHIIGHVLGVPETERDQLRGWSEDIVQYFDAGRGQSEQLLAEKATTEFAAFLKDLIALRRRQPDGTLLSDLVAAERAGQLSETELISTCMLILMAGHGSTIDTLGTGMLALIDHPDELAKLRRDRGLMDSAVQEMFRYESPLPFFHRYARVPVEFAGQQYAVGTKFGLLYGAANRDPSQFPNPDQFQIERPPNRHVAFGRGAHLCLGNNLSRLDMAIFFDMLLERTVEIARVGQAPSYKRSITERGLLNLEIAVRGV